MRVELVPFDPSWSVDAERLIALWKRALGSNLLEMHHIGSTAIGGIVAKPVLDLLPIVVDHDALAVHRDRLDALGFEWKGEFGIEGRRYFVREERESGRRVANVHAFEQGSPDIVRHLAFRDYLRGHPDEARAYEREKLRAAEREPDDVLAYNREKQGWIRACERRALDFVARTR